VALGAAVVITGVLVVRGSLRRESVTAIPLPATSQPVVPPVLSSGSRPPAAPPASVSLTIQTNVPGAQVFAGKEQIGTAPGPIHMHRTSDEIELTVTAPRHLPAKIKVKPSSDTVVSVTLLRQSAPSKPKSSLPSDLEDPF
jgi:hypothetical protein